MSLGRNTFGESGSNSQFLVQTPLGTQSGLMTQPHYEAPGDLQVEIVENAVINIGLVRLSLKNCPKLTVEQPNSS